MTDRSLAPFGAQANRTPSPHAPHRPRATAACLRSLVVVGVMVFSTASHAADPETPQSRYQADQAACLKSSTHSDRDACLKEAGAVLQESQKNGAVKSSGPHSEQDRERNRTLRCEALPLADREDCLRRMKGEGVVEGSVEGGGVLRTLERPIVAPPTQ